IDDLGFKSAIQEELDQRRVGEEAQVRRIQKSRFGVLEIASQKSRDHRMMLHVRNRAEDASRRRQKTLQACEHAIRSDEVFQYVSKKDAIDAARIERRIVLLDIKGKDPIQSRG